MGLQVVSGVDRILCCCIKMLRRGPGFLAARICCFKPTRGKNQCNKSPHFFLIGLDWFPGCCWRLDFCWSVNLPISYVSHVSWFSMSQSWPCIKNTKGPGPCRSKFFGSFFSHFFFNIKFIDIHQWLGHPVEIKFWTEGGGLIEVGYVGWSKDIFLKPVEWSHHETPPLKATTALLQSIWINEKNMAEQSAELEEEAPRSAPNACACCSPTGKSRLGDGFLHAGVPRKKASRKKVRATCGLWKEIVDQNQGKDAWSFFQISEVQ